MEGKSEEKLASVSNLVTVFENSRYGVVGVERFTLAHWQPPSSSSSLPWALGQHRPSQSPG